MPRLVTALLLLLMMTTPTYAQGDASDALVFTDTVWLDNGTIKLGVSPSVGRITWFGFSDGENVLWVNPETMNIPPGTNPDTWINYGGDKVWNGPQALWPYFLPHGNDWPPAAEHDGQAWTVEAEGPLQVTLSSGTSDTLGIQIHREIVLHDNAVRITNRLEKVGRSYAPVQPWTITQVQAPASVALSNESNMGGAPCVFYKGSETAFAGELRSESGFLVWTDRDAPRGKKLGTMGPWIAALMPDQRTVFTQFHSVRDSGAYPERASLQLYVGDGYSELELLGPMESLAVGESATLASTWTIKRSTERIDSPEGWDEYLQRLAKEVKSEVSPASDPAP